MATITKQFLSSSITSNGMPITVNATASTYANAIHTAVAGTSAIDEVYIYASNATTASTLLTIGWGDNGTSLAESASNFKVLIPSQQGRQLIVDGRLINNSKVIYAYATTASVINLDGFVNNIA